MNRDELAKQKAILRGRKWFEAVRSIDLENAIAAILDEPQREVFRDPWPGEIAEARLKADLQAMTTDRDRWRNSCRERSPEIEDLTAQVEGLTAERDSAIATAQQREQDVSDLRVQLAACKEERDALRARIEGADIAWRYRDSLVFYDRKTIEYADRYRLVPDPLPEVPS